MCTRPSRDTLAGTDRTGRAGKAVTVKDLDRCRVLAHDIMYNHVGRNSFRHVSYPRVQQDVWRLLACVIVLRMDKFEIGLNSYFFTLVL